MKHWGYMQVINMNLKRWNTDLCVASLAHSVSTFKKFFNANQDIGKVIAYFRDAE